MSVCYIVLYIKEIYSKSTRGGMDMKTVKLNGILYILLACMLSLLALNFTVPYQTHELILTILAVCVLAILVIAFALHELNK